MNAEPPCAGVNDIPVELIASATAMSMPAPSVSVWPSRRLLMLAPWMRANFALPVTFMFDGATSIGSLYAPVSSLSVTAMSISRSCRTPRNEGLALAMSVRLPMAVPTPKFSCMEVFLSSIAHHRGHVSKITASSSFRFRSLRHTRGIHAGAGRAAERKTTRRAGSHESEDRQSAFHGDRRPRAARPPSPQAVRQSDERFLRPRESPARSPKPAARSLPAQINRGVRAVPNRGHRERDNVPTLLYDADRNRIACTYKSCFDGRTD